MIRSMTRRLFAAAIAGAALALAACATVPATTPSPLPGVSFRTVETNGVNLRVAEMGEGPLVVLVHGWPESWYSWRHQIPVIAAAGYRVIAPDMRGYGHSDKPAAVTDYDITHTTADIVGLIDAYGAEKAIVIGHDWGAIVTWNTALLHPERVSAMIAMSVPNSGRASAAPTIGMKAANAGGENFYYILYHQEPGVAETEYDADPRGLLSRLYASPTTPRRNMDRNWEITPQLAGARIKVPVGFIAGEEDIVIRGAKADALRTGMTRVADDLRGVTLVPGAGHWIQQEKPEETNAFILGFLSGLKGS